MLKVVKKTTKKALSVLLAVVMVMTSMSVCFGTFTFTASAAWEEYTGGIAKLIEYTTNEAGGENDIIKKYTNKYSASTSNRVRTTTITADNYAEYVHLRDTLIYLYNVMLATSENTKTHSGSDNNAGKCKTITSIGNEVINKYKEVNGSISASAEKFIKYVLSGEKEVAHPGSTSRLNGTNDKTVKNTLTIKVDDAKGYLKTLDGDYTTVGDADKTITFSISSSSYDGNTELKYSYVTGQDSCGKDKTETRYHHYIWDPNGNYLANNPPTVSEKDSSAKNTVVNYASEVDNWIATYNYNKMALMSATDIETLVNTLSGKTTTIKNYISNEGEDQAAVYDQFFPGYADKIATWESTAEDAKNIAVYSADAKAIAAYMNSVNYGTFNWGAFDEATIRADYANFTTTYQDLLSKTTVYDYFVQQGIINDAALKNFRDNVVAFDLEDTKEAADALYAKYKDGGAVNPDLDGEEENPIKPEVDAGILTGYINSYNGYTAQVKNAIFPDGIEYLLKLQEEFECTVSDCIVYFAEHAYLDYTDTKTDAVIAEIETAKNQLAALEALRATVDYAENLELLTPVFELAEEFIDYLYTLLADRFALQVANADAAYTEIGRPTANLTLEQFSKVNGAMSAVEDKILTFLDDEGKGSKLTADTRALFAALETNFEPAYNSFKQDRAFDLFEPSSILIRREDNTLEYFRKNADLDNDGKGEYEVTDENVMEIINLLEGALKDPTVAKLLGDLINKDEDGNPTGEAFNLANLINGLLEKIYTDDLLNTIISFLYPIIGKAFADVWATLPEDFTTTAPTDMGDALVKSGLALDDVDTAVGNVGIALSPTKLAEKMNKNDTYKSKYSSVIKALYAVDTKTHYDADGNYVDPWKDARLYKDKIDEDGKVVIDTKTGEAKQVYKLEWGITDRASFIDAACAALSGLEPLLYALLLNQPFVNENTTGRTDVRGCKIGTSKQGATATVNVTIVGDVVCALTLDPITLYFTVSGNDGYSNVLAPIFEVLGLENIPKSSDLKNTKDFLEKGLFAMIDQLVAKVSADPIETILGIVPNLVYALEADLVAPLLDLLEIEIYYEADAAYAADIPSSVDWITGVLGVDDPVLGAVKGAMKAEKEVDGTKVPDPIKINVGQMIDLKSMGVNLSGGLKGILDLVGIELPNLDTAFLAKAGELTWKASNRTRYTYTYMPTGATKMQAAYIEANKADVLVYLVKWAFANLGELLAAFGVDTSSMGDLVTTIFDNLAANSHDAVAALVELLNQKSYDAKTYTWFNGSVDGESVVGNSAYEIYLNPNNDWTKEKAEYLYNNLDALLTAALTMAGVELDLGATISGAIDGLLTDKTLTALAALLAKLDLNALLAKEDAATEGEEATPDANEPETVAEGEEAEAEAEAEALDVNALVNQFLGLDLAAIAAEYADIAAAKEADPEYVYDFGVDAGDKTFAAVLAEMLEPLSVVLAFILDGGNLTITIGTEEVTLLGANGFNNAIVPLLEALGCTIPTEGTSLEKTINALVARIDALTTGDVIKNIIDLLPGVFYFITSNGLATAVMNLLQPVLVIVDTIRPVFDVMALINDLKIGDKTLAELLGGDINLKKLDLAFIFDLLPALVPAIADLDLTGLKSVIYDICNEVGTEYTSAAAVANTANGKAMKGAYTEDFDQADLLTVVLSFVLEWATIEDNAKALDEMLGTNGIIASLNTVFEDVEITYGTPNWMYWFKGDEEAFNSYVDGEKLPNTLASIDWEDIGDNDWDLETAQYFAENIDDLVDTVIAMINKDKADAPKTLAALISSLLNNINADTLNSLVGTIAGLLGDIDDNLLDAAGYLLGVDLVGLKAYKCEAKIDSISDFINELAVVLDTYAGGLIDFLFFGDDYRFAKKSDKTDTIVINGGLGYEKGLALILEALGCELPEVATTKTVLGALATRLDEILANPVNEVLDLLPNLIYVLNANGLGIAIDNLLQPVYALLDKLAVFGLNVNIADLLKFNINGKEIAIDLANLSLANVVEVVETATDLPLDAAEKILVGFATGKIEKGTFGYKMTAAREDVITILLVVALELVSDEKFAAKLDEMLGTDGIVADLKSVFADVEITYGTPDWMYLFNGDEEKFNEYVDGDKVLTETLAAIDWDNIGNNDWDEETAQYFADNIDVLVDTVIAMINKDKADAPKTVAALVSGLLDGINADTLNSLVGTIAGLLGDIDNNLLEAAGYLLGVDLVGLKAYKCTAEINSISDFINELADVLDKYAGGLVNFLFFGDDYRFVKKVDGNDAIVINGGLGYEKGLAIILEALGCELPEEATTKSVLGALADRVDEILDNPVDEILDLLPNLIYFLNANGLGIAIDNLLQPVYVLLDKLAVFGINVNIADLLKFNVNGKEIAIDLANLSLANVVAVVETATDLPLDAAEKILVGFATGKIEKGTFGYKMIAARADVITIILAVALELIYDDAFATKLDEMLGTNGIVAGLKTVFADVEITYGTPEWGYWFESEDAFNAYLESGEGLPDTLAAIDWDNIGNNDWDEETAKYFAENIYVLVDTVIAMLNKDKEDAPKTVAALVSGLLDGINADTLNSLVGTIAGLLGDIDDNLLDAAGYLLGVDLVGLKAYKCTAEINSISDFINELAAVLDEYAGGLINFLFFGDDYRFVKKANGDAIVINGGLGYEKGLAIILEALGCEDLPTADKANAKNVLAALATRLDEILANPVNEVLDLLPNLIYVLNANGLGIAIDNLLQPVYALLDKLAVFGINVNIADLLKFNVNGKEIAIDLANLSLANVVEVVETATDLPLDAAEAILVGFATGKIEKGTFGYKMTAERRDVITILLAVALELIYDDAFATKLDEMLGTNGIVAGLKTVFAPSDIEYTTPNWDYAAAENGTVDAMKYSITYPNNWTEETAKYVAGVLTSVEFDALITSLIDANYASLGALLTDKVNVFNSATLESLVGLITGFIGGIDDGLLKAAGVLLNVDLAGLKTYEVPADIDTVEEFAAELANILSTYIPGVIEWLLLGEDYTFFVKEVKDGEPVAFITISGAEGYANGLALLLEALGCENLPAADAATADIINGVLASVAARISAILANPVVEVVNLLPNILYFLNTNGVAAVIDNVLAAVNALLDKLAAFDINIDIEALVDLKALMGLEDTDAAISLDNLSMADVLEAVGLMVGLDLTYIEDVLVGFALGKFDENYKSVSSLGKPKKMVFADEFDVHDMITVLVNLVLITIEDEDNAEFLKGLVGEDIYTTIMSVINLKEYPILDMKWQYTDRVGQIFTAKNPVDPNYDGFSYGAIYSETNAQYIANNVGEFADNVVGLLGLNVGDTKVKDLAGLLTALIDGTIYKRDNVIAIQEALAGILSSITGLEVSGVVVGGYIAEVLKTAGIIDLSAVGAVEVAEFKDGNKEAFIDELCKVLAPLNTVLQFILADKDLAFFADLEKNAFVKLNGANGYSEGIALLLEALYCKDVLTEDAYKAAAAKDAIRPIIEPLLNKVDVILANPAEEILGLLTSLVYFINSNGIDTVVKNTLNAVYAILEAIKPVAEIDLYALIGIDFSTLDFDGILDLAFDKLAEMGYSFTVSDFDAISELTIGQLESYDSASGKKAYRMKYLGNDAVYGDKAEMVTSVERLIVTFIANEGNQKMLVDLLKNELGMSEQGADTLGDMFNIIGDCAVNTDIGMEMALAATYYVFYGVDTGVDSTIEGMGKLDDAFNGLLDLVEDVNPDSYDLLIKIFGKIDKEGDVFNPGNDGEDGGEAEEGGIAANGLVKFFQKISTWFQNIGAWFKNLFSFSFLKR